MFDTLKTIGIVAALALSAIALLSGGSETVGTAYDSTTFTNPVTFEADLNYEESTETITADDTLTNAESGKVVYIGTAGVDLTLPAAASSEGTVYRVVVSANFTTTNMTITGGAADASDDLIYGVLDVAGAVVLCAAEDTISFVNTAELVGDYVELRSNGTNWLLSGQAGATGGITCTDAD